MGLKPGEAAVLIVRRSDADPEKYFFAVRRSDASRFDNLNDFHIGPFQVPVAELGQRIEIAAAIDEAVSALRLVIE